mgnify:FL=1
MARDYYEAAIPEPVELLGQRLMPYSLGHHILLERFDNPFVVGGDADAADLFSAVLICCSTYEEFIKLIREENLIDLVKKWAAKLGKFDLNKVANSFKNYIDDSFENFPKYWVEQKYSDAKSGANFAQAIKIRLLRSTNLTETEILNRPLALSVWDVCTILEQDGAITLFSKQDEENQDKAKQFEEWLAKLPEEQKVKFGVN